MNFTPGPWKLERSEKGGYNIRDKSGNVPGIARTYARFGEPEDTANAHLIAAAPEMYLALEATLPFLTPGLALDKQVRAALAKARGEVAR